RLQGLPPTTPLGAPTLTVTIIRGGAGTNVVPPSCTLILDRRLVPGEDGDTVGAALAQLAGEACPLPVVARQPLHFPAYYQPDKGAWLGRLAEWSGGSPALVPYGTNAWAYGGLARECVVLGPGSIDQAHGVEEWVEIAELEKLAGIYHRWWGLE
ncbi:MAG: M20 family metallopeptidase, partial [Armatimonadetes bacterium]|nr:M20 family metallopeptidase [Armatimonadota bacterium]